MFELSLIKETVTQVAEAITVALDIETEIVDRNLKIISGTGRYKKKVGGYEEKGNINSPYIYGTIMRTGMEYICLDTLTDPIYKPTEGELAEISCPIQIGDELIGIIGLIAFNKTQQKKICAKSETFLNFLRRMSELISSKLIESQSNTKLALLLESMPEGLLATDTTGKIFSCNFTTELLLKKTRFQLLGTNIVDIFPNEEIFLNTNEHNPITNKELVVRLGHTTQRLFFTIVPIPTIGTMYLFIDAETAATKIIQGSYFESTTSFADIHGQSAQMREVKQRAKQVSNNDSTILITGESGTGKELFARAIHNRSNRSKYPFVSINCGAIPESLLESELFGYEAGAFTGANIHGKIGKFELANHGTIFLDEIGDMPLHLQVKLLHFLQNRTVERVGGTTSIHIDVRIIAATNKSLETMIKSKEFREDLYFRLSVIPINIPPLRDRAGDVQPLLDKSLLRFNSIIGKNIKKFSNESLSLLLSYSWPGNVRELENTVEYCVNMETSEEITTKNIPDRILFSHGYGALPHGDNTKSPFYVDGSSLKVQIERAEYSIISSTLDKTGYSLSGKRKAAKILQISESTLYRKLRELNISSH